jgi:hypothetical protein
MRMGAFRAIGLKPYPKFFIPSGNEPRCGHFYKCVKIELSWRPYSIGIVSKVSKRFATFAYYLLKKFA